MKKALGALLLLFAVAACERPASVAPTLTVAPIEFSTNTPTAGPTLPPVLTVVPPTEPSLPDPTETLAADVTPTDTIEVPTATNTATNTPGPTSTPSGPPIEPNVLFGAPAFTDPMDASSFPNWAGESGTLPDTVNIRLELKDGKLEVTGKRPGFSTWWFSWPLIEDAYLEMAVNSGTCTGKDAYGLIFRGPTRGAPRTYGYVVAFSCDGSYLLRRIDNTDPYTAADLIGWTQTVAIKSGANQDNIVGVRMEGGVLTLYANRFEIARFTDNTYREGRYGVFVGPSQTVNYFFRAEEINFWEITE